MTEIYLTSGHVIVCDSKINEIKNAIKEAMTNNDNLIDMTDDKGYMVTINIDCIQYLRQRKWK